MRISSISGQNVSSKSPSSKALHLHNNTKEMIANSEDASKMLKEISKKLEKTKVLDLHVKEDATDNISFFWTKHNANEGVIMSMKFSPYSQLILDRKENGEKQIISSDSTGSTYDKLRLAPKTFIEKLKAAAEVTLKLDDDASKR